MNPQTYAYIRYIPPLVGKAQFRMPDVWFVDSNVTIRGASPNGYYNSMEEVTNLIKEFIKEYGKDVARR